METGIREPLAPKPFVIPREISSDTRITFEFSGVYMLISGGEIIYIGQTSGLGQSIERCECAISRHRDSIQEYQTSIAELRGTIKEHLDAITRIKEKPVRL